MTTTTLPTFIIPANVENKTFEDYIKRLTLVSLDMDGGTANFDNSTTTFDNSTTSFDGATVSFTGATIVDFPSSGLPDPIETNNIQSVPGGNDLTIKAVDQGYLILETDDEVTGGTGNVYLRTGNGTLPTANSGNLFVNTGIGNQTGSIFIFTSDTPGQTGGIDLTTGETNNVGSGSLRLITGRAFASGDTGDIILETGQTTPLFPGGADSGSISLTTGMPGLGNPGNIDLVTIGDMLLQAQADISVVSGLGDISLTTTFGDVDLNGTDVNLTANNDIILTPGGGGETNLQNRVIIREQCLNILVGPPVAIPANGTYATPMNGSAVFDGVNPGSLNGSGQFIIPFTGDYLITLYHTVSLTITAGGYNVQSQYLNVTSAVAVVNTVALGLTFSTSGISYNSTFVERLNAGDAIEFSTIISGTATITGGSTNVARATFKYIH